MNTKMALVVAGVLALLATSIYILNSSADGKKVTNATKSNGHIAQVFKSPTCGCCKGYASALGQDGFQVTPTDMSNVNTVKDKYNIPDEMRSCHTTIVGKYFIEGHVPIEAVNKLLKEQPDIDGIALPGMPIGTPGMPGRKEAPYVIYQVKDGIYSEFMTI